MERLLTALGSCQPAHMSLVTPSHQVSAVHGLVGAKPLRAISSALNRLSGHLIPEVRVGVIGASVLAWWEGGCPA